MPALPVASMPRNSDPNGRPGFLTLAMWFVWLLRADLRGGEPVDSREGQREFLAWWLLWGHQVYRNEPIGEEQIAAAMDSVLVGGRPLPRLLRTLYRASPRLQELFDIETANGVSEYLSWFRSSGLRQLASTENDSAAAAAGAELQARLPEAIVRWFAGAGRHRHGPREVPNQSPGRKANLNSRNPHPVGVNLVGFAYGELGLGEDVRMLSRALESAAIEHSVIDVPTFPQTRSADRSVAHRIRSEMRWPVTIFCLSPFDTADFYARGRDDLFGTEIKIGYWPWELPEMPSFWRGAYELVDEVWAASRYTAAAFRHSSPIPVRVLPPCVEIPEPARVRAAAAKLRSNRGGRFQFYCPFDRNSFLTRKFPAAAVEAFRRAFPASQRGVELLLRVNGERGNDNQVQLLRRQIQDDERILLIEGTLPRSKALALLAASDCLVSPHRAEGFGRNIAEAILLEIPVLATGFGGCVDFLRAEEMVEWRPVQVREGEYPHATGQWWAEPDIAHLARRMREVREQKRDRAWHSAARTRREQFRAVYDPLAAGARYRARLEEIFASLAKPRTSARAREAWASLVQSA